MIFKWVEENLSQILLKVISRYVDGIMIRAINHEDVVEFSEEATVPVINGLTNIEHPCQALDDMLTVYEHLETLMGNLFMLVMVIMFVTHYSLYVHVWNGYYCSLSYRLST